MNRWLHDLHLALACIRRAPGFALTVTVTLATAIGALLATFGLYGLLLWKPLPYPDAGSLLVVHQGQSIDGVSSHGHQFFEPMQHWYRREDAFDSFALVYQSQGVLASHPEQPRVNASYVTPEYFDLLGVPLLHGRAFDDSHGVDRSNPAILISERLWREQFGGDVGLVDNSVHVGDQAFRVIGVVAAAFTEPAPLALYGPSDVWLPWDYHGETATGFDSGFSSLHGLGRLRNGESPLLAHGRLDQLLQQAFPTTAVAGKPVRRMPHLTPLREAIIGDTRSIGLLLFAGAALLLAIACSNIGNLFFARAVARQRTLAVQAVLGARAAQLRRLLFAEAALLCVIATMLGLLAAAWWMELIKALAEGQLPRLGELGLDLPTVLFALVLAVSMAWLFARLTASLIDYDALRRQIQGSGKGAGIQVSRRMRHMLILVQAALATVMVSAALSLCGQAFWTLRQPLGFLPDGLTSLRIDPGKRYPGDAAVTLSRQLRDAIADMPQVQNVTRAAVTPVRAGNFSSSVFDVDGNHRFLQTNLVDDRYFDVVGQRILRGRAFTDAEVVDQANVVMLSASAAAAYGEDMLGKFLYDDERQSLQVVGIAADLFNPARHQSDAGRMLFRPYSPILLNFIIRARGSSSITRHDLQAAIRSVDPELRIWNLIALPGLVDQLTYRHRLVLGLTAGLSLLSLGLAMVGIYGVVDYNTRLRRYEMGVRLALGMRPRKLVSLLLRETLQPLLAGIVVGVGAAILACLLWQPTLQSWLQAAPGNLIVSLATVTAAAMAASWWPVRRALLDDPIQSLRSA